MARHKATQASLRRLIDWKNTGVELENAPDVSRTLDWEGGQTSSQGHMAWPTPKHVAKGRMELPKGLFFSKLGLCCSHFSQLSDLPNSPQNGPLISAYSILSLHPLADLSSSPFLLKPVPKP